MIKNLNYVQGEPVTNRARYWIWETLRSSGEPSVNRDFGGVNRKTIWNFVAGGRSMTIENLAIVADSLGLTMAQVFEPTPDEVRSLTAKGWK